VYVTASPEWTVPRDAVFVRPMSGPSTWTISSALASRSVPTPSISMFATAAFGTLPAVV